MWFFPRHAAPPPAATDDGSVTAVEEQDSSPLSFSFSVTSAETVSPSVRAAEGRTRTATVATNEGGMATPQDGATTATTAAPGDARPAAPASQNARTEDYFRYFTTPPAFADPFHSPSLRVQEPDPAGTVAVTDDFGERVRDISTKNDLRTAQKRSWAGTPDPESEHREARRMRPSGTTPAMRSAPTLPNVRGDSIPNPWVEGLETGRRERTGDFERFSFTPVVSSTPAVSSVPRPRPTERSPPDLLAAPRPDRPTDRLPESLLLPLDGADNWREVDDVDETHQGRQTRMEVDNEDATRDSMHARPSEKRKGKARATSADLQSPERDEDRHEAAEGGWDEAEVVEARQRSLRQTLLDRTGGWSQQGPFQRERTGVAGPSRSMYTHHEEQSMHASDPQTRDEHTSRGWSRTDQDYARNRVSARHFGTHNTSTLRESGDTRQTQEGRGWRAPSDFAPLPNTRAAEYMATRASRYTDALLRQSAPPPTQRSMPPDEDEHGSLREDASGRRQRDDPADFNDGSEDGSERGWNEQAETDGRNREDGEVLPTALREQIPLEHAAPTPIPEGGFPVIHRDDPETSLRGMAIDWMREVWSDAPNTDVLIQVFNYRFAEDDVLNGRIAESLRWAFEQLSGERDFDVVPPEPEDGATRRQRDLPSVWVIRGLSPRATAHAIARGFWSFPAISFAALPRTAPIPSWLFTLEGFLEGNEEKIRAAVMRVLLEEDMQRWILDMLAVHPTHEGRSMRRALTDILGSLRVETMQLTNGTYLASVFMRSPTRDLREWRRWVAELRTRRYRSFAIGTGRVRHITQCAGCTSVSHLTHLCPFPRTAGWNGPEAGKGVFGEHKERINAQRPYGRATNARDSYQTHERRRNDGERRGGDGSRAQRGTPARRRNERDRNGRPSRYDLNDRNGREDRSDRENQDPSRRNWGDRQGDAYGSRRGRRNY